MKFDYKADYNRCKKHENVRILYTGQVCPLCEIQDKLKQLNILVDSTLEVNKKIGDVAKTMERLF